MSILGGETCCAVCIVHSACLLGGLAVSAGGPSAVCLGSMASGVLQTMCSRSVPVSMSAPLHAPSCIPQPSQNLLGSPDGFFGTEGFQLRSVSAPGCLFHLLSMRGTCKAQPPSDHSSL